MIIAKEPLDVTDKPIRQCMQNLGSEITRFKNLQQKVRAQINKSSRIFGYLRDLIWRNKYVSAESKVRIHKTAVGHVVTYAVETRADITKAKNIMIIAGLLRE
ncbi:hypothetical protein Trydic_g15589 [Trypoxylus dichotomus]